LINRFINSANNKPLDKPVYQYFTENYLFVKCVLEIFSKSNHTGRIFTPPHLTQTYPSPLTLTGNGECSPAAPHAILELAAAQFATHQLLKNRSRDTNEIFFKKYDF
jgi:hypothetical protein